MAKIATVIFCTRGLLPYELRAPAKAVKSRQVTDWEIRPPSRAGRCIRGSVSVGKTALFSGQVRRGLHCAPQVTPVFVHTLNDLSDNHSVCEYRYRH